MPHKKKIFKKENSEKFLLLRGNSQAVNADGQTLENILVPVSKNYKPGTSLILSNIAALSSLDPEEVIVEQEDIEGIFDASTVDTSDAAENVVENLLSDVKKLKFSGQLEKFDTFSDEDFDEEESKNDNQDKRNNSVRDGSRNAQNCSENWKMFNEKFDKILEEYEDSEIGSLEDDMDMSAIRMGSPEPFIGDTEDHRKELDIVFGDYDEEFKEKILNYADDSVDEKIVEIVTEKPLEFDCESILSICSNKYNHPAVIKEKGIQRSRKISRTSDIESETDSVTNGKLLSNTCNTRKKGESPEDRKERQRKFKEVKKLRRELKKQNKEAFKEEKKLQSVKDHQNAAMKLL